LFFVVCAILAAISDLAVPGFTGGDGLPEFLIKGLGLATRFEETRVLAKSFLAGISR
jgi:hypothetical protein